MQQRPTARDAEEMERPIQRNRDRWPAERIRQLDAERRARRADRDDDSRRRDEGRGRGRAI
jgi:hypothetical protein